MGKRLESSNIDPDTFLDSYRPITVNSPPAKEKSVASKDEETRAKSSQKVISKDNPGYSADAQDYLDRFVRAGAESGYKTVNTAYLADDVFAKLQTIDRYVSEGRKKRISAYVNNVLRDHFEKYFDIIRELVAEKINSQNPFKEQCKKN